MRIFLLFVVMVVSVLFADDERPTRSNREIVFALCDSAVHRYTREHWRETVPTVSLLFSRDTFTQSLRPLIIQSFFGRGMAVSESPSEIQPSIEILIQESSISFGELFTDSFFGRRKSERRVQLIVSFIAREKGNSLRAAPITATFVDTVLYSEIERLSEHSLPMTSVQTPSLSMLDSLLEPAIITMASAVAIYLFFTIRS